MSQSLQIFMARQPIFDRKRNVFGYELLFRSGLENFFRHDNLDEASSHVLTTSSMVFDLGTVTGKRKAFVNLTRTVLLSDSVTLLPADTTVVELLESIQADEEVLAVCQRLKSLGYQIALDDFVYTENNSSLLTLADIVKVDFLQSDEATQASLVDRVGPLGIRLLAEKVETQEDFTRAVKMGYDYFQGYFFARPEIISRKDIPAVQLNNLQLLREIHHPNLNIARLEELLKHDVSLSYKLLRYINSAFFGWKVEIRSVRHALVLLGDKEVRKWATLVALANIAVEKPRELMVQAVFRARFLETLAPLLGMKDRAQDLFLMGLFSLIDAIVDRPAAEILSDIPIAADAKMALVEGKGHLKGVLDICLSYEKADWDNLSHVASTLVVSEESLPQLYLDATEWARVGLQDVEGDAP